LQHNWGQKSSWLGNPRARSLSPLAPLWASVVDGFFRAAGDAAAVGVHHVDLPVAIAL